MRGPSLKRVDLDSSTRSVLSAFADVLIPGDEAFPAPSQTRVISDFMSRYISAEATAGLYPPGVVMDDVRSLMSALGPGFVAASAEHRTDAVAAFAAAEPELFGRLQALVYAGYYSRPEVHRAIADTVEGGRDFRGTPQPYGYADVIESWDRARLSSRGSYLRTEDVMPVDPDALSRLVDGWPTHGEEVASHHA